MKKFLLCLLLALTLLLTALPVTAAPATFGGTVDAESVLLMEANTGTVLFEKNADKALPPASVTKVMTMLLVMEAIDSGKLALTDIVTASEYATSMGGSQVFLKAGETMTVLDMLKSVVIASANDCAVALAEHIAGSEEAFVAAMNARAAELGMQNTHFENTNGLDDTTTNHVTSARDIAIMSRELICKHPYILELSSIWMDTIRDGAFGLTNTNRLIRFYPGANGLKTGSTSRAKFCISASAKRGDTQLIAVIMAAPTRDARNELAKRLFDYGFANFTYQKWESNTLPSLPVRGGKAETCTLVTTAAEALLEKGTAAGVTMQSELPETLTAPIRAGDVVGKVRYMVGDNVVAEADVLAGTDVARIGYFDLARRLFSSFFLSNG